MQGAPRARLLLGSLLCRRPERLHQRARHIIGAVPGLTLFSSGGIARPSLAVSTSVKKGCEREDDHPVDTTQVRCLDAVYWGEMDRGGARMIDPTVTLTLPTKVYHYLQRRARQHQRPLEDEATLTLAAAVAAEDALPDDLSAALGTLVTLDDETLERVSHSQPTVEDGVFLDALVDTRRRRALTPGEEQMLVALVDRHDRAMALRAEAVAVLHARGIDVGERVARA